MRSLRQLSTDSVLLGALIIRGIFFSIVNLRLIYLPITLTAGLGLPNDFVSTLQMVMSAVMLAVLLFGLPAMQKLDAKKPLFYAFVASVAAHTIFMFLPVGLVWPVLADGVLVAVSIITIDPLLSTMLANSMHDADRALLMALMALLQLGVSAVFLLLGGFAAALNPRLPMLLIALLSVVCVVLLAAMLAAGHKRGKETVLSN